MRLLRHIRLFARLLLILCAGITVLLLFRASDWTHLADEDVEMADGELIIFDSRGKIDSVWMNNCKESITAPKPHKKIQKYRIISKRAARGPRKPSNRTHVMFMGGSGRLGNKMFQLASLVGIAHRHGYKPCIREEDDLHEIFRLSGILSDDPAKYYMYGEKKAGIYDPCLESLPRDRNWILTGYYQSWKYFQNVSHIIRKTFRFKQTITDEVSVLFEDLKVTNRTKIGVHVRRGDMDTPKATQQGYTVATPGFFRRAMDYFRVNYRDPVFFLCSDDIIWAAENIESTNTVFVEQTRNIDFAVLASCDHNIVSTGSYGWWAAWLARGETVYYKNFPEKDSWLAEQYKKEDYFPPAWKGME